MHWSEWAAVLLLVICAIPVVLLLRNVLWFMWGYAVAVWYARKPLVTIETPFGLFTKQDQYWSGHIESGDVSLFGMIQDSDGKPSPQFLERLPALLGQLPQLEQTARQQVDSISGQHELFSVSDSTSGDADFVLGFNYDQKDWEEADWGEGEMVNVQFQEGRVVGHSVLD